MLSFAYNRFDGKVPQPCDPSRSSAMGLDESVIVKYARLEV